MVSYPSYLRVAGLSISHKGNKTCTMHHLSNCKVKVVTVFVWWWSKAFPCKLKQRSKGSPRFWHFRLLWHNVDVVEASCQGVCNLSGKVSCRRMFPFMSRQTVILLLFCWLRSGGFLQPYRLTIVPLGMMVHKTFLFSLVLHFAAKRVKTL